LKRVACELQEVILKEGKLQQTKKADLSVERGDRVTWCGGGYNDQYWKHQNQTIFLILLLYS
jgi:hypothetical protein